MQIIYIILSHWAFDAFNFTVSMWLCPRAFRMLSTLAADAFTKAVLHSSRPVQQPFSKDPSCEYTQHSTSPPTYIYPVTAKYMCIAYALMSRKAGDDGWVLLLFYNYIHNRNALKFVVSIFSYLFWAPFVFLYFICCISI